jgi:DNA-binding response OmpR family regulator
MPHVLVIEDDEEVRRALLRSLSQAEFATTSAPTGLGGLQTTVAAHPDVIVLDLGLPDIAGTEVLRMVRAVSQVPIIISTACDDESQIVSMLEAGADDYIVKPFGGEQLIARVRALLRRGRASSRRADPAITVGDLVIDPAVRIANLRGQPLQLTPKEFDMLRYLAERHGEVVSKSELLSEVWKVPFCERNKTVDVHLSWLRRKLGETAQSPRYLHTVHAVGVRLAPPPS